MRPCAYPSPTSSAERQSKTSASWLFSGESRSRLTRSAAACVMKYAGLAIPSTGGRVSVTAWSRSSG